MSNLIFNLRIGLWHFQIMRDRPWVRISRNAYWVGKVGTPDCPFIELY